MSINNLPEPNFIDRDANKITAEIIALYEKTAGKILYPAQADRVFIDVIAYREMLIRTAINEAGKQNLLAFANGVMLDYLGDFFGVIRLEDETDEQLRGRIRLAPESYATTGSRQAYIYHTLSTDASIIDADAVRGENGEIFIHVLTADGVVSPELIQKVLDNTSDEKKRPLSDLVHVAGAKAFNFELSVKVYPLSTIDPNYLMENIRQKAKAYTDSLKQKLGRDVVPSQIIDALSGDGVWQIEIISPSKPIVLHPSQWANCTKINLTLGNPEHG
ncbi:baseplate J/gp47 family protein [Acinetobacter sp. c3-l95]|uniref:baseplate assembly protein n=1 Tax=Acinetobacter sp. c3-l95 TaxID=3342804 RepID=UPI0035B7F1CB